MLDVVTGGAGGREGRERQMFHDEILNLGLGFQSRAYSGAALGIRRSRDPILTSCSLSQFCIFAPLILLVLLCLGQLDFTLTNGEY